MMGIAAFEMTVWGGGRDDGKSGVRNDGVEDGVAEEALRGLGSNHSSAD